MTHPLDGPYEDLPVAKLRLLFRGVRERALRRVSLADFKAQVGKFLREDGEEPETARPADWVKAAVRVRHACDKCRATGTYVWGLNGQYSGVCYRCEGKGYQHDADRRRNWGYDNAPWAHNEAPAMEDDYEDRPCL